VRVVELRGERRGGRGEDRREEEQCVRRAEIHVDAARKFRAAKR
jgi:hypothetical protein